MPVGGLDHAVYSLMVTGHRLEAGTLVDNVVKEPVDEATSARARTSAWVTAYLLVGAARVAGIRSVRDDEQRLVLESPTVAVEDGDGCRDSLIGAAANALVDSQRSRQQFALAELGDVVLEVVGHVT
jgi:hypothetical protein